jgi:ketosteroid isomerase-like protein
MRTSLKLALALVVGAIAISGCGSDDSAQEADRAAITETVDSINAAVSDKDGAAYCALLEPATFFGADTPDAAFDSQAQCARETNQILKQAGEQRALEVEEIRFDGDDAALATFTGRNGEARFVKVDDTWYLSLGASETARSIEGSTESGTAEDAPTGAGTGEDRG